MLLIKAKLCKLISESLQCSHKTCVDVFIDVMVIIFIIKSSKANSLFFKEISVINMGMMEIEN